MSDTRTLQQLAREALGIQDACNLSGLVYAWARSMRRLCELCPDLGTDERNTHPINVLWSDKCASLTGSQYGENFTEKYNECEKMAAGNCPTPVDNEQKPI